MRSVVYGDACHSSMVCGPSIDDYEGLVQEAEQLLTELGDLQE